MKLTVNRREEMAEEIQDCRQAERDCLTQGLYADAAKMRNRANEISRLLYDWAQEGAAQAAIAEIMSR
jgi:hypothetical protein